MRDALRPPLHIRWRVWDTPHPGTSPGTHGSAPRCSAHSLSRWLSPTTQLFGRFRCLWTDLIEGMPYLQRVRGLDTED